MQVKDIMSSSVVSVGLDEPVIVAARMFKRYNLGILPVCDQSGRLRGVLTDRDLVVRCIAAGADPNKMIISDIMTRGVVTVSPENEVSDAVRYMKSDSVRRIPVVEKGKIVGLISLTDMAKHNNMEAAKALAEISLNIKRK